MSNFSNYLSCGVIILALIGAANAKDHPHVADADREYEAVFSHGENPCAKQSTTIGFEQCFGKEVEFTENHLTAFLDAVRAIVADERGACVGIKPACGVRQLDLLNNADRAWREYKKIFASWSLPSSMAGPERVRRRASVSIRLTGNT